MLLDCLLSLMDHLYMIINYSKFIIYNILHQFSFFFLKIFFKITKYKITKLQKIYIVKFINVE